MTLKSTIELKDMILLTDIGTYAPDEPVPNNHLLDLTLDIATDHVLLPQDGMVYVFDYDPLISQIKTVAATGHRDTQEWLITQIVQLCAQYPQIHGADVYLRKFPVDQGTGTLGVRVRLDKSTLSRWHAQT